MAKQRRDNRPAEPAAIAAEASRTVGGPITDEPQKKESARANRRKDQGRAASDDDVRRRAYELYEQRGGEQGRDWDDWFQAEEELRKRNGS